MVEENKPDEDDNSGENARQSDLESNAEEEISIPSEEKASSSSADITIWHFLLTPLDSLMEGTINFICTFIGLLAAAGTVWLVADAWLDGDTRFPASFGATSVLLFTALGSQSPMGDPWNALVGQLVGSSVGVSVRLSFDFVGITIPAIQVSFSVSLAIFVMTLLRSLHPPAGATAAIAILGGPAIQDIGYYFMAVVFFGTASMLVVSAVMRAAIPSRRRPNSFCQRPICVS